jgi:hypothetical protein
MMRRLVLALLALTIASCASVSDLEPRAGEALPQKPALASRTLTADELLELPPQAAPRRVDELNRRGDVRQVDRFDLPPPDAEPATPSTTGPDNQDEPRR